MVMSASEAKAASSIKEAMDFQTKYANEISAIAKALDEAIKAGRYYAEVLMPHEKLEAMARYMISNGYDARGVRMSGVNHLSKLQFSWK